MTECAIAALIVLILVAIAVIIVEPILYHYHVGIYKSMGFPANWGSFWVLTGNNIIQLILAVILFLSQTVFC